jgi:hypothetical protein
MAAFETPPPLNKLKIFDKNPGGQFPGGFNTVSKNGFFVLFCFLFFLVSLILVGLGLLQK